MGELVLVERREDGVAVITLNNPLRRKRCSLIRPALW